MYGLTCFQSAQKVIDLEGIGENLPNHSVFTYDGEAHGQVRVRWHGISLFHEANPHLNPGEQAVQKRLPARILLLHAINFLLGMTYTRS